jgi:hypothetical protein
MNAVTKAYLAACAEPGSPLRTAGRRLEFEQFFGKTWGARQLARPLFVPEAHLRQAADDLRALFELMFTLPRRSYDGDLPRMCADLGMDEQAAALACAAAEQTHAPLYTRPDLYYDGASFTLLETNTGTECGGVDAAAINEAYLALPEFREFADEHGLGYVDTGECIATYLRDLTGKPDPVVALIDIKLNFDLWYDYYRAFVAHMADRGIEIKICHIADLGSTRGGKLTVDGVPVDVTLRYFTLEELCTEPQAQEWLAPVLRAHVDGKTAFVASLDYGIYSNKGVLAMVSELRGAGQLAAEEAAVVDRMLPWTRRVTAALWERCRAERDQLLLKPSVGGGGYGVTTGWTVTDEEWEAAFTSALQRPYVVQRRADVILESVPDDSAAEGDGTTDWLPAYGMFIFERGYAGSFIRTHPAAGRSVVNASTGATFTSVFSFHGSE